MVNIMQKKHSMWLAISAAVLVAVLLVTGVMITAGGSLDVVASNANHSFQALWEADPSLATREADGTWTVLAPDGSAKLTLSGDGLLATLRWEAQPFLDAGLDTALLPEGYVVVDGEIQYRAQMDGRGNADAATPLAAMQAYLMARPDALGYHAPMDHFGVMVGSAGMLEWAKDLARHSVNGSVQDKDLVYVLNPDTLIAAGVDPAAVQGWAYAQVEVMDMSATRLVYKFLKPFDIQ